MSNGRLIQIPTIDYVGLYYADILKMLVQYRRRNVPEITDENEYEPFTQLERSFSLTGHYNSVMLDIVANESLLTTSKLLESVRNHLRLIGYDLSLATPASTDVIYELSKIFTAQTEFVPQGASVRTEETEEKEAIIYEAVETYTIDRTDQLSYAFGWISASITVINNTFETGDSVTVNAIPFIYGTHFSAGADTDVTAINIANAINTSTNDNIFGKIKAIVVGSVVYLINLDDSTEITVSKNDGATPNLTVSSGTFTSNLASILNTDGVFSTPWSAPKPGDCLYLAHKHIQIDRIRFAMNTFATGITGVWEYYDGELEDESPISVQNLGSTLKIDIGSLLPDGIDYTGAIVRVKLQETSAYEDCVSFYESGKNYIVTSELLGQSSPSTTAGDYVIGANWQPLLELVDNTSNMTADGDVDFLLPEDIGVEWIQQTVNSLYNGYYLRYRIVSVSTPTAPIIDRIKIDEGAQYLKVAVTQGQTRSEDPLGSSNGDSDQEFELTYAPLIPGSLVVEVDEGTGFTAWSQKANFLSSNSNSKDYTLEVKADDTATIKFSDGIRGKIPALGVDNIRCSYRIGADQDGNVGAKTIIVNKEGISFVNRIWNPRQATGWTAKEGSTEEDLARVKIEGPASIRVLDRAISASDVEYLASNYKDSNGSKIVSRAKSFEETFGVKTLEAIVVGTGGNQLSVAQRQELENYFNGNKTLNIEGVAAMNHEVTVVNYSKRLINVTATVYGGNKTEIENAIRAFIHPEAKYNDGVTYRWKFSTATNTEYFRVALLYAIIYEVDPTNITNVIINSPASDVALLLRELPMAGTISITVV